MTHVLHVGSVKANIGHLGAASGAAGLAKLLLILRHRRLPKLISLNVLNPELGREEELAERGIAFDRECRVGRPVPEDRSFE